MVLNRRVSFQVDIGSATRLTYDVIHSLNEEKSQGLLVSLDMDNAFNAVDWNWIKASLAYRGFPEHITDGFCTLYNESFSRLTYNGHISEPIYLERSARQGDPISGYLFIIALEYLLDRIRLNKDIRGIKIGSAEIKLSAYADDVLCLLDGSPNSLRQLFDELGIFAKFSGLKPNIEKAAMMRVGSGGASFQNYDEIPLKMTRNMKLLGVVFSNDLVEATQVNYKSKIADLENLLKQWQRRNLSKLIYCLASLPKPADEMISRIDNLMFKFIWNGKRSRIKREILTLPHNLGGQGMTDLQLFIVSLKIAWVKRYLTTRHPWTLLADKLLAAGETSCVWDKGKNVCKGA